MSVVTFEGVAATSARLVVPWRGSWYVDAEIPTPESVGGTLTIAGVTLRGTVVRRNAHAEGSAVRVLGGAGWSREIPERGYHSDAGVKATTVLRDAATDAGETLGTVTPDAERVGVDWARVPGLASDTLDAAGGLWWVDYAGVTHVGERPSPALGDGVTVLGVDVAHSKLSLHTEDLGAISVGATVQHEGTAYLVRSLVVDVNARGFAVTAGFQVGETTDRAAAAISRIASRIAARRLSGAYRYRVQSMAGVRANLMPADPSLGLPNLTAISCWSAPGVSADLADGSPVVVQFLDGDRGQPAITAFAPPDHALHSPTALHLGGREGKPVARVGDLVSVFWPPTATFAGLISGTTPITGTLTILDSASGVIQGGSQKVNAQ